MDRDVLSFAVVVLALVSPLLMQLAKWLSKYPLSRWLPELQGTLADVTFGALAGLLALFWVWAHGDLRVETGAGVMGLLQGLSVVGMAIYGYGQVIYKALKKVLPGPKTL